MNNSKGTHFQFGYKIRLRSTVRCANCGCTTHWEPLDAEPGARHGVNLRNFDPALLESVTIRRFDGADTWQFLD